MLRVNRTAVFSFLAGCVVTTVFFMLILGGLSPARPRVPHPQTKIETSSMAVPSSSSLKRETTKPTLSSSSSSSASASSLLPPLKAPLRISDPRLSSNAAVIARLRLENPQTSPGTTILFMYLGVPSYIETALFQCRIWNLYSRIVLVTDQTSLSSSEFVKAYELETVLAKDVMEQHSWTGEIMKIFDQAAGGKHPNLLWGKRFVYLGAAAIHLNLKDGFWHPEADNML